MKKICVFCGTSSGNDKIYIQETIHLAKIMIESGFELVCGGSNKGLMFTLTNYYYNNIKSTGIIFKSFEESSINRHVQELIVVDNFQERKRIMISISDCFIILPGGYGTLNELFEVLSVSQLENFRKPICILNLNNYFDDLLKFIKKMVKNEFLKEDDYKNIVIENDPETLIKKIVQILDLTKSVVI